MNEFTPLVNISPSLSLLSISKDTQQKKHAIIIHSSKSACIIFISAICAYAERECSQRETTCCQEMHLNSPLSACTKENANQFFQRQIARGAQKGEIQKRGGCKHTWGGAQGATLQLLFLHLGNQNLLLFILTHAERSHVLSDLLYLARAKTLFINSALV
jgi:hypothetical protein